jgi:hypothetical protein
VRGNRTHLGRIKPHTGFEDRKVHQEPIHSLQKLFIITPRGHERRA